MLLLTYLVRKDTRHPICTSQWSLLKTQHSFPIHHNAPRT